MKTDPMELNDLAEQQPELVKRLSEAWFNWARRAFVTANVGTAPGLKSGLDLSQRELKDTSGKNDDEPQRAQSLVQSEESTAILNML